MDNITWYVVGTLAATLTCFGFVPQIIKMWQTKSVKDVSPVTLIQMLGGVTLWAIYGVHLKDPVVVIANLISLATFAIAILVYLRCRKKA